MLIVKAPTRNERFESLSGHVQFEGREAKEIHIPTIGKTQDIRRLLQVLMKVEQGRCCV